MLHYTAFTLASYTCVKY